MIIYESYKFKKKIMQNLYMMAALIREDQLNKMAVEFIKGLINVEQAMENYNVADAQTLIERVNRLKEETKRQSQKNQSVNVDLSVLAA